MSIEQLSINCDMGESFGIWKMGEDEEVMPWVDMANIACGFHASDPNIMSQTIQLALKYNVKIGAHPSYNDTQGFGRRSIAHTESEITHLMLYQIGAIKAIAALHEATVEYVKPHGALYNDMMRSPVIFKAIARAAQIYALPLMILSTSENEQYLEMADDFNVPLLFEAFADRSYLDNGQLTPRDHPKAVLHNSDDIYYQVMQIAKYGSVTTVSGQQLPIQADTICIHGDNPHSIVSIRKIKESIANL
ncbi:5-oxoprolinase subunit PxpA [Vibrio algarum]|uniref:5-oxoprolinase subunit PxpA n=1 Tax=Vibrio algarum TaxID=3020714 RepID=A0ABT4YXG2_9VIBR|nr:5-oxoprolinase subunit PxpA [Vibrio sp. KJ40-1]MDB1126292.1 5-oxoprolinase subunit PxpA [Vibrio sp. KJ40-1]